jgi:hypothetical protein
MTYHCLVPVRQIRYLSSTNLDAITDVEMSISVSCRRSCLQEKLFGRCLESHSLGGRPRRLGIAQIDNKTLRLGHAISVTLIHNHVLHLL